MTGYPALDVKEPMPQGIKILWMKRPEQNIDAIIGRTMMSSQYRRTKNDPWKAPFIVFCGMGLLRQQMLYYTEEVFRQMQAPFLADARFSISSIATQWAIFEQNLVQMRPALVVLQVDIAPGTEVLIQRLAEMQVWQGVAILVLPQALRDLRATYEKSSVVRGV
jgi:hypothetical protein